MGFYIYIFYNHMTPLGYILKSLKAITIFVIAATFFSRIVYCVILVFFIILIGIAGIFAIACLLYKTFVLHTQLSNVAADEASIAST